MSKLSTISLRQVPLLRLLVPFLVGVLLAWWHPSLFHHTFIGWFLLFSALPILYFGKGRRKRTENLYWGVGLHLWLLLFGSWRTAQHYDLLQPGHFAHQVEMGSEYNWSGRVEEVRKGESSTRIRVDIQWYQDSSGFTQPCRGKVLLYLADAESTNTLLPGYNIKFRGAAEPLPAPLNPAAFNFKAWQARQNVFHRIYSTSGEWPQTDEHITIKGLAYRFQEHLTNVLRHYLPADSDELAVAAALILGQKDGLSTDLRDAYAETGAVHVLAVSGLHLGFIAWGLGGLFGWGPFRRKSWRWARLAGILSGIWLFALITGLSPSVMRAATMFSAVWIGVVLGRQSSIYNTLAASAFLLLLINPFLLLDIGFQLSYLALLGIVFFQPKFHQLLRPSNWFTDKAWSLISVALAAQLTTFPLSLYYFHQFPIYFFLSGLVVVLAASLILGLGILLFLFSWLPPLASLLAKLLYGVLWGNNAFVRQLQQLPGHLVDAIWIDAWQLVALFVTVLLIGVYTVRRRPLVLMAALGALLLVFGVNFWHQQQLRQQKRIIVYHQYKATVIDAISGRYRYTISSLEEESADLNWSARPYREKVGATTLAADSTHWQVEGPVCTFFDRQIVVVDDAWHAAVEPVAPRPVDILVLRDTPNIDLDTLRKYYEPKVWVCDGSNYPAQVQAWQLEAQNLAIDLHSTREDGAYILDL